RHLPPRRDGLVLLDVGDRARRARELRAIDTLLERGAVSIEERQRCAGHQVIARRGRSSAVGIRDGGGASCGSRIVKTAPRSEESTWIEPPCSSTIFFTIASPSPVPPRLPDVTKD